MSEGKRKKKPRRPSDAVIAKDVEARKVKWAWRERIPFGMLTVVAGRPDQGKGLFAAHVAADLSRRKGNVLYSAVEDDAGLMTRPRLEAAGADLNRILLWRFSLPSQLDELAARVDKANIKLIVMDPFAAHVGRGVSRHSDSIRRVLTPLSELAELTGCAIIIIEHALKRVPKNSHPLAAIGGNSSGVAAASRMGFVFGVDPKDADRRLLCAAKSNLRESPPALAFETDTEEVGLVGEVPYMVVQGETEFDPRRLLGDNGEPSKVGRRPDKRADAAAWLTQYLFDAKKPVLAKTVLEDGKQHGLTNRTLRRAADDMGVIRKPPGGGPGCTYELPAAVKKAMKGATNG